MSRRKRNVPKRTQSEQPAIVLQSEPSPAKETPARDLHLEEIDREWGRLLLAAS